VPVCRFRYSERLTSNRYRLTVTSFAAPCGAVRVMQHDHLVQKHNHLATEALSFIEPWLFFRSFFLDQLDQRALDDLACRRHRHFSD
jgi:hypothetical protein